MGGVGEITSVVSAYGDETELSFRQVMARSLYLFSQNRKIEVKFHNENLFMYIINRPSEEVAHSTSKNRPHAQCV